MYKCSYDMLYQVLTTNDLFSLVLCIYKHFFFSAFTMFIAITIPFFGGLLGFFGGFAFAPTTYFVSHEKL